MYVISKAFIYIAILTFFSLTSLIGCGTDVEETASSSNHYLDEESQEGTSSPEDSYDETKELEEAKPSPNKEVEEEVPEIDSNDNEDNNQANLAEQEENHQEINEETFTTPLPWEDMIEELSFFASPIPGAGISTRDTQLPGAPRPYRNGTHEGLDYYNGYCGVPIAFGDPVFAAAGGTVARVDHDFQELTKEERQEMLETTKKLGYTPEDDLDKLRGRQVWIKHQEGIISRYAHLDEVNEELSVGDDIYHGGLVGTIGNSGTSAAVAGTKDGPHLHFEIWVEDHYLGEGLPTEKVRTLWQKVLLEE